MAKRLLVETDKRLLWKLAWNAGYKGMRSVQKHKARLRKGEFFPPFLYVSVINSCNLRCQGCWVDVAAKQQTIDAAAMHRMISEAQAMGNAFFGILGGEPLMHPEILDILEQHPDCYFQIFTNGQFITDEVAARMRRMGNVTPLVSIEGNEIISDERRGRGGVWSKTMQGVENCLRHRVMTGVCTSLCQTNIDDLLTEKWLDRLIEMGVMYAWFHVYRPVGPEACPELALTPEQQLRARKFVVEMRAKKPIVIIDAYYDGDGQALCPAATGFTHHIGPWGDIEPCPIIQLAKESIYDTINDEGATAGLPSSAALETPSANLTGGQATSATRYRPLAETFNNSQFLREFREVAAASSRGCIVLERPDLLHELAVLHNARDTTARKSALAELAAMQHRPSQSSLSEEVPEKNWYYRFAKRYFFNDFGAYDTPRVNALRQRIEAQETVVTT
ncbi:MAG: radical SAM/SPASM domain-containing protein [Pirellulales bacterium]